jgi:predicted Zn finger-like uncharacterized protein
LGRMDADRAPLDHGEAPPANGTVRCPGCGQTFQP